MVPLKQYTPIDRKQLREEAYQLTESFNPFSSINIAVREAGEVRTPCVWPSDAACLT